VVGPVSGAAIVCIFGALMLGARPRRNSIACVALVCVTVG